MGLPPPKVLRPTTPTPTLPVVVENAEMIASTPQAIEQANKRLDENDALMILLLNINNKNVARRRRSPILWTSGDDEYYFDFWWSSTRLRFSLS